MLTDRETVIVKLVTLGHTNKAVGNALGIAEGTVKAHLVNIYRKTNTGGRVQLVLKLRGMLIIIGLLFAGSEAHAATLSGSAAFDQSSGLYTYNYTVVNDTPSTIWNVDVFVGGYPVEPPGLYAVQPIPVPFTAPSGWTMYGAFSGSIASPPYSMDGGFYEFYGPAIQPDTPATNFSIVTSFAPTTDAGGNDFFLYGSAGIVAYGNTIVPDGADWLVEDPPYATPLPATLPLFAGGLGLLALLRRKAKR